MSEQEKSTEQILEESDQFWSVHELTEERIGKIKDLKAQGHARAAMTAHWQNLARNAEAE